MWFLYHIEHSINSLKICKKISVLYYEALCKRKKCRFDRTLFDDRCISDDFLNDFYLITVEKKQNLKISESY